MTNATIHSTRPMIEAQEFSHLPSGQHQRSPGQRSVAAQTQRAEYFAQASVYTQISDSMPSIIPPGFAQSPVIAPQLSTADFNIQQQAEHFMTAFQNGIMRNLDSIILRQPQALSELHPFNIEQISRRQLQLYGDKRVAAISVGRQVLREQSHVDGRAAKPRIVEIESDAESNPSEEEAFRGGEHNCFAAKLQGHMKHTTKSKLPLPNDRAFGLQELQHLQDQLKAAEQRRHNQEKQLDELRKQNAQLWQEMDADRQRHCQQMEALVRDTKVEPDAGYLAIAPSFDVGPLKIALEELKTGSTGIDQLRSIMRGKLLNLSTKSDIIKAAKLLERVLGEKDSQIHQLIKDVACEAQQIISRSRCFQRPSQGSSPTNHTTGVPRRRMTIIEPPLVPQSEHKSIEHHSSKGVDNLTVFPSDSISCAGKHKKTRKGRKAKVAPGPLAKRPQGDNSQRQPKPAQVVDELLPADFPDTASQVLTYQRKTGWNPMRQIASHSTLQAG
ncbi:hypothetical protein K431DRAFT_349499 [Polychaeton citri CBS 116435]|uniref:Uncharacterized protein n=1 Tax=Polychaeton citri CBS 116435 TaxID=1314669 RepID=A0A9P4UJ32_9PEZI|nr:hypothetical protein K431DRAFT_349499 [Polychaeton citri CBS 116435]